MKHLSEKELSDLKNDFSLFDKDAKGYVTLRQFSDTMRSLGQHMDDQEIADWLLQPCIDEDAHIDFDTFLEMRTHKNDIDFCDVNISEKTRCLLSLRQFDKDHDGVIPAVTLFQCLTRFGRKFRENDVNAILMEVIEVQRIDEIINSMVKKDDVDVVISKALIASNKLVYDMMSDKISEIRMDEFLDTLPDFKMDKNSVRSFLQEISKDMIDHRHPHVSPLFLMVSSGKNKLEKSDVSLILQTLHEQLQTGVVKLDVGINCEKFVDLMVRKN
jgi:calmodulin